MIYLDSNPGRTAFIKNKEYLFCSGYNYLGVNHVPEYLQLLEEGLSKYGWLFPSSRISNTQLGIFDECEALLTEIAGSGETVLLPSGFNAGRLATHFDASEIQNTPDSHPAINRRQSPESDFTKWSKRFIDTVNTTSGEHYIFASDSVNALKAVLYDFKFLMAAQKTITAIIDDSHGIGITGIQGKGIASMVPRKENLDYIFTYSLSKAFGIMAGAISCSKERAALIRGLPEYTAVTPPSPAQLYAFLKGQEIYNVQREKLFDNITYFERCIKGIPGIKSSPGYPVFVLSETFDERFLFENGIIVSSFSYPDPAGARVNRIILNALHTGSDLDRISACLDRYIKKIN